MKIGKLKVVWGVHPKTRAAGVKAAKALAIAFLQSHPEYVGD